MHAFLTQFHSHGSEEKLENPLPENNYTSIIYIEKNYISTLLSGRLKKMDDTRVYYLYTIVSNLRFRKARPSRGVIEINENRV